jgi:quinol monooxygenase YgiN
LDRRDQDNSQRGLRAHLDASRPARPTPIDDSPPLYTERTLEVSLVAIVWQFDIRPEDSKTFERLYGADGEWTQLSRKSRSFLGSSFLRDVAAGNRYLLVEYWSEMVVYEKHVADFGDEVKQLERQRERFVVRMENMGVFTALNVPDRTGPAWSRRSG